MKQLNTKKSVTLLNATFDSYVIYNLWEQN